MSNKIFTTALASIMLLSACRGEVQQPKTVPRVARLGAASPSATTDRTEAFQQGLRELGYVEGKNIIVEYRSAEGKPERLPALAAELVSRKVDIIVTIGPRATRAAKEATSTIPIVMAQDPDPVAEGFVASLARPGGNITGLSTLAPELGGKRLELLKETVPRLSRVAVFGNSTSPGYAHQLRELELAAGALKVKLQFLDVQNLKDIETAFRAAKKGRADAILTLPSGVLSSQLAQIVEQAVRNRLPAIYPTSLFVDAGGLMSYGTSITDLERRAAVYVDKILKGRTPADLPVEQPMNFDFVVSLIAADKIGLKIPPNVLVRADRVIR